MFSRGGNLSCWQKNKEQAEKLVSVERRKYGH
jgi:hypothetical protein